LQVKAHTQNLLRRKAHHTAVIYVPHEVIYGIGLVKGEFCACVGGKSRASESGLALRRRIANLVAFGRTGLRGSPYTPSFKGVQQTEHMAHLMYGGSPPIERRRKPCPIPYHGFDQDDSPYAGGVAQRTRISNSVEHHLVYYPYIDKAIGGPEAQFFEGIFLRRPIMHR